MSWLRSGFAGPLWPGVLRQADGPLAVRLSLSSVLWLLGQLLVALLALAVIPRRVPSQGQWMGFLWSFSSSGSVHLCLPPPSSSSSFSPLLFLFRGRSRSHGLRFIALAPFALYCFLFFSSGQIRWAGLPSSLLLGGPLRHGPFSSPFRVFQACLSSRTHQVSQATSFQLILVRQLFVRIPHRIVLRNLIFPDVRSLELLDHFLRPPVHLEGFS